jgi:hypothetical protein
VEFKGSTVMLGVPVEKISFYVLLMLLLIRALLLQTRYAANVVVAQQANAPVLVFVICCPCGYSQLRRHDTSLAIVMQADEVMMNQKPLDGLRVTVSESEL